MKTRLYNARILTMADDQKIFNGEIVINDDKIEYVGPEREDSLEYDINKDCKGNLLLPGFKNAHTHSGMSVLRSLADDLPLSDWLNNAIFPVAAKMRAEDIYYFTQLSVLEYLTSGITACFDMFISSGEMQDEAVLNSLPMTDDEPVEEKLKRCVLRMEEGHSIAQAAYDEELFEPVYGRMLLAGERSGSLEHVLGRLTELLEENCGNLAERLVGIIDPLLSGVLMFTVGLSLLSVMLPLIGMMNSIA